MRKPLVSLLLSAVLGRAACGGGEGPGEPLVSGSLAGEYKGQAFVPAFGFATIYKGSNLIGLGDGPLNCASPQRPDPPSGRQRHLGGGHRLVQLHRRREPDLRLVRHVRGRALPDVNGAPRGSG